MISTLFNNHTIIYREFLYFGLDNFKVVCCRFIVCGKGIIIPNTCSLTFAIVPFPLTDASAADNFCYS